MDLMEWVKRSMDAVEVGVEVGRLETRNILKS